MGWGIWFIYLNDVDSIEPIDYLALQKWFPFPSNSQYFPLLDDAREAISLQANSEAALTFSLGL